MSFLELKTEQTKQKKSIGLGYYCKTFILPPSACFFVTCVTTSPKSESNSKWQDVVTLGKS